MIFIRDGVVTEATFANVFIVDKSGTLITKTADNLILCGITRNRLIEIAKKNGLRVEEREFGIEELMAAKEVFLTSSALILRPVAKIDGKIIGEEKSRKVAQLLSSGYKNFLSE
jgi:D-alanine transaminase